MDRGSGIFDGALLVQAEVASELEVNVSSRSPHAKILMQGTGHGKDEGEAVRR